MKKVATLGMVAITIAVNMIPMRTEAAGLNAYSQCSGGQQAITISGNCNLQDLQSQLQNAGVNTNTTNWADAINQQNCPYTTTQQANDTTISDVLGAQYSNETCSNSQLADAVKNAQALLNQQNCNTQTQEVTQTPDTTQETDTQETDVTQDTTTTDTGASDTTTDTNTGNSGNTTTETPVTEPTTETPTDTTSKSYAQQVVDLVNVERAKEGLAALTIDENVAKAATVRAKEIQTKFEHVRPDGTGFVTALKEQGVSYRGAGENIAWGQKTPQEVVTGWMNSPGHRANIMNKNYVHIGVGNLQNSAGTQYWVQIFTY